jgi:hypothetical protein
MINLAHQRLHCNLQPALSLLTYQKAILHSNHRDSINKLRFRVFDSLEEELNLQVACMTIHLGQQASILQAKKGVRFTDLEK